MRIVFMGTPDFALPSLEILLKGGYEVAAAVTVPDKPAGRGQRLASSVIKQCAERHGVPVLQPLQLKDPAFIAQLTALAADVFVVVAFRILPVEVFSIPRLGAFNLHASLLPKYRGAAPINWAIIRGERETGVTTFFLKEAVDTGNIILQARTPVGPDTTAGELHDALAEIGAEIVLHTVRLIEAGKAVPREQESTFASPAPKIFKEHCRIDWTRPAREVHNFVRGLSPRPCAHTYDGATMLKIYRTKIVSGTDAPGLAPGAAAAGGGRLLVGTGDGPLEVLELQQEGKKRLTAEEFLRGYHCSPTTLFT
jgi:methionyl-tRNA formyltransferase